MNNKKEKNKSTALTGTEEGDKGLERRNQRDGTRCINKRRHDRNNE